MDDRVQAVKLNVLAEGSGFPILCLHGHPGAGRSLSVFTQHLSQRFRTIAPDLRGYGDSQTQKDFLMIDHLTDLEIVLDRYRVSRCLVLGWSLGGILAVELALKFPERVSGLILVATSARPWGDHPPISLQDNVYTGIAAILNRLQPGWQWNIDTFGKRSLFRHLVQTHTPATYKYLANEAMYAYLKTSGAATRALSVALQQGYNRLSDLDKIQCPCLVLAGEQDRHITAASSREMVRSLQNCESHCYPNTAHLLPWEIPDQILADIDRWLAIHPEVIQDLI
ncbi:alpha/beta hydrolase [Phormidesmis priestleyi ULC007]|uniref:Alpha/beta hydrolase n=1 Tax=Phormidesmis priestleyi ULC007 TaxID=1920490 RepID=A0A2T1D806_9CYAN|nr:alpha/beta hydrolase [Phormidesmis priestleyi]PSB16574.1 alpha/beta hydrolase [Phormidesmis priestleyi ULC007]PZO47427.1 MAG: alpha/beta hydrolase [Phormidesmis priestleyi]